MYIHMYIHINDLGNIYNIIYCINRNDDNAFNLPKHTLR